MYFIQPSQSALANALEAWSWLDLGGKTPIAVTAFGDVFFNDAAGVWFLDTIEGTLTRICGSDDRLDSVLADKEKRDHYLLAGFVDRAVREGNFLTEGECYQYSLHPAVGGKVSYDNVTIGSFVVATHIAGQIHSQIRDLAEGTKITSFKVVEADV